MLDFYLRAHPMLEKRFRYPSGTGIVKTCQRSVPHQLKQVVYISGKKNQFGQLPGAGRTFRDEVLPGRAFSAQFLYNIIIGKLIREAQS